MSHFANPPFSTARSGLVAVLQCHRLLNRLLLNLHDPLSVAVSGVVPIRPTIDSV